MLARIKQFLGIGANPKEVPKEEVEKVAEEKAKPRIGYVHLSGCTGDVMSLSENYDILAELLTNMVDIVYGQTLADVWEMPEMDLVLVEGSVCLQDEHSIKELKEAREKAGLVVAFGSCAATGCFTRYSRGGQQARPDHESFVPIADLVKVDCAIPGCPPSPEIIAKTVVAVINGDMDYLQPMIDLAGYTEACGCDLQYKVVNQALCIGCGTCAMACQTRALTMTDGRPELTSARCVKCGICYVQCPRSWWPADRIKQDLGLQEDEKMVLGTYKEVVTARSTDKSIQKIAQDGGIVSALFCYALDEKLIDGAVVAGPGKDFWKPEPMVALTSDEILAAAGTKYTFSPNVLMLKKAVRQYGLEKVGTVAIPCQSMGIRKMQSYPFGVRFLADKIALLTGIFCMENFPFASLQTFISEKMGVSPELVEKMDIGKGKFWVHTADDVLSIPLKETHGYEQSGCKVCLDYVAELSDVATGSVGSPDGWSTVFTRTDAGETIFKAAVDAGVIETKAVDTGKFGLEMLTKLATQKKEKAMKEIDRRKSMGLPVPFKASSEKEDPLANV